MTVFLAFAAIVSTLGVIVLTMRNAFLMRNLVAAQSGRERSRWELSQAKDTITKQAITTNMIRRQRDEFRSALMASTLKVKALEDKAAHKRTDKFTRERRLKR